MTTKTALIVEGGAMRGIYSAGILDTFLQQDFNPFDLCIGVSAGASNAAAYLGHKYRRNYHIYTDLCRRPEFKNVWRFVRGGHLIDIDWLWDESEARFPIGMERIKNHPTEFLTTVTCAKSAEAQYLPSQHDELFQLLKASGNMPFVFKNKVNYRGKQWFDGGVSDSVPVKEAYRRRARKIMILRSNPASYVKQAYRFPRLLSLILRQYPNIAERLKRRHQEYNDMLEFLRNPPQDCEIIEICPPENFAADQFTMDKEVLDQAYQAGRNDGETAIDRWNTPTTAHKPAT